MKAQEVCTECDRKPRPGCSHIDCPYRKQTPPDPFRSSAFIPISGGFRRVPTNKE